MMNTYGGAKQENELNLNNFGTMQQTPSFSKKQ